MRTATRLALGAAGLAAVAYGVAEVARASSEPPETPTVRSVAHVSEPPPSAEADERGHRRLAGGTLTTTEVLEPGGRVPWHALAAVLCGLGLLGWAIFARREPPAEGRGAP